jgi:L-amino acid N-acyltransferase YncA
VSATPIAAGRNFRSKAGRDLAIRPVEAADNVALAAMFGTLSLKTVERRYLAPRLLRGEAARREAERLTHAGANHIVLVAQDRGAGDAIVAVAELAPDSAEPGVAESAVLVADAYQGEGIGRAVAEELAEAVRTTSISRVRATVHAANTPVRRLIASLGRPYSTHFRGTEVVYELSM